MFHYMYDHDFAEFLRITMFRDFMFVVTKEGNKISHSCPGCLLSCLSSKSRRIQTSHL